MRPVLVTGATGFLGKHLVEQLRGTVPPRVFCRGSSPWDRDPQVEVIRGDITSAADVSRAMQGVAQVYHLAGIVSRDPGDRWLLYQVHVQGTRNVCEAALSHQPEKIVLVSSSGTIAVSKDPVVHNENSGYKQDIVGEWPYYLSKIFAEKLALSYRLPLVVVNPGLLLGPGDDRSSSTGDLKLVLEGKILAVPLGGASFVDARDVAAGLIAAMRSGKPGERYLLGGANWTFRETIETVARISGVKAPRMQPGLGASLATARLLRRFTSLQGLDEVTIKMSALFWYCDSSKARAELGFETRDPVQTLTDTVEDIRRRERQRS